MELPGFTHKF